MSVQTQRFVRKPLYVDAVQVTAENMAEVATWCKGKIETDPEGKAFIKVDVIRPQRARQSQAYADDYVLKSSGGYKIYTPKAFRETFLPVEVEVVANKPRGGWIEPVIEAARGQMLKDVIAVEERFLHG